MSLATDAWPDEALQRELGVEYVEASTLYRESDVISLHVPLTTETHHLIDAEAFAQMKPGVMLINTSRGALVDARALIQALKTRHVGAAGLDVYEEEGPLFFRDLSAQVLQDDVLARLLTFPNVLITSHQGFLTREALANIADTTLASVSAFERGEALVHEVGHRAPPRTGSGYRSPRVRRRYRRLSSTRDRQDHAAIAGEPRRPVVGDLEDDVRHAWQQWHHRRLRRVAALDLHARRFAFAARRRG